MKEQILITVHIRAIATNRAYRRSANRGIYMTEEAKDFKNAIGYYALRVCKKFGCPVEVDIEYHYADKRRRDVDGAVKLTLDALEGICYDNDYQVQRFSAEKFQDGEDKVVIRISKFDRETKKCL